MKKITTILVLIFATIVSAFGQTNAEKEILKINAEYDQAVLKNDVAFMERILADDYTNSGPAGKIKSRTQILEDVRNEATKPTYKLLALSSDEPRVKVLGNMAIVTAGWTSTTVPANDLNAEPHKDAGRYTAIYEKRNGRWMMIAEHVSEQQHDRKLMEQQVLKMGLESVNLYKNRDYAAMERMMADDAVFINPMGKVKTKAEVLAEQKNSQFKVESVEISDQKVRVIGNGSAVETGLVRYKGIDRNGKPSDVTERYTTTWVWRGGRWQIASDHTSTVKK